jgi:hypothetical protein
MNVKGMLVRIEPMEIQFVVWSMIRVTKPLVVRGY